MNFEIEDITVGNERNVIGVGETITFELSVELGNNITFSGTFMNVAQPSNLFHNLAVSTINALFSLSNRSCPNNKPIGPVQWTISSTGYSKS